MRQRLLAAFLACYALLSAADARPPGGPQSTPLEVAVEQALDRPISLSIHERPLDEALRDLGAACGLDIQLDQSELADSGVAPDASVSVEVEDVSLRTALELMLKPIGCTWAVQGDAFLVTSASGAETMLSERWHAVADLLPPQRSGPPTGKSLIAMIESVVAPTSWDDVGGPGKIEFTRRRGEDWLVVQQTTPVHDELTEFLSLLRNVRHGLAATTRRQAQEAAVERALDRMIALSVHDEPLDDVLQTFASACALNIEIDETALTDAGIARDTPVNLDARGISVRSALERMLLPLDLTWMAHREVLLITSMAEFESITYPRVYDVGNLISKRRSLDLDYWPPIELVTSFVAPTTWDAVGGPGAIAAWDSPGVHAIVVQQTRDAHEEVALWLDLLLRIQNDHANRGAWKVAWPEEEAVEQALDRRVDLRFDQTPLETAILEVRDAIGVDLGVDLAGLALQGIDSSVPVSLEVADLPARVALQRMLDPIGCTVVPRRDMAWITTKSDETPVSTRIYDVRDLVSNGRGGAASRQALGDLIAATIEPLSWADAGGNGVVEPIVATGINALIVQQTDERHAAIDALLASLRRSRLTRASGSSPARPARTSRPAHAPSDARRLYLPPPAWAAPSLHE